MSDFDASLLEFPCEYTIKILGRAAPDFEQWVRLQIEEHADTCSAVELRPSREGRFVSVNATFTAQSLDQLQRIHQQLRASERVTLML
jgi:putative lipoic acid-binding regulatory protein